MGGICPKCIKPGLLYLEPLHQAHCTVCGWSEQIKNFNMYIKKYPDALVPKLPILSMLKGSSDRIVLAKVMYAIAAEENKLQGLVPSTTSASFDKLPGEAKCVYLALADFILLNYKMKE